MPPRKSNRLKNRAVKVASAAPSTPPQESQPDEAPKTTDQTTKPVRRSKRNVGSKQAPEPAKTREHELEDEMYNQFLDGVDGNLDEDDDHIPASGTSCEAAHITSFPAAASVNLSPVSYTCEYCKTVLKTKHGFTKHVMTHRTKECNSKRPSAETIEPLMESFVVKALNEIALEHGDEKKQFVSEVLEISQCGVSEWNDFVSNISYPILQSVCKPTKMLPANQYEEQLISLNKLLNNEEVFSSFLAQLMSLNATSANQNLGKMILFRLLTKLVDETLHFVFSEMRVSRLEQQDNNSTLLDTGSDTQEYKAFYIHMRKLIQKYYMKGLRHGSKLWLARCACIRQRFVEGIESDCSPTVDAIISDDSWEEDENGVVKLKLDSNILKYFVLLENIIESLFVNDKTVNSDTVLNIVLSKSDKTEMLEIWHSLTSPFLSELESIVFMKDIIHVVCNLSLRLEVGRDRNVTSMARVQKYALRTDLKRN